MADNYGDDDEGRGPPMSLRDRIAALNSQQASQQASPASSTSRVAPPIAPKPKPAPPTKKKPGLLPSQTPAIDSSYPAGSGFQDQSSIAGSPWYQQQQQQQQPPPPIRPPSYDTAMAAPSVLPPSKPALPPRLPPRGASGFAPGVAANEGAGTGAGRMPPPSLPPRLPQRTTTTPALTVSDTDDSSSVSRPVTPQRSRTAAAAAHRLKSPSVKGRGKGGSFKGAVPGEAKRVAAPAWGTADLPPLPQKKEAKGTTSGKGSKSGGVTPVTRSPRRDDGDLSDRGSPPSSSATPPMSLGNRAGRQIVIPPVRSIDSRSRSPSASPAPPPRIPPRSPAPVPPLRPSPSSQSLQSTHSLASEYSLGTSEPAMARQNSRLQAANVPASMASSSYGSDVARAKSMASLASQASSVGGRVPPGMVDRLGQDMQRLDMQQSHPDSCGGNETGQGGGAVPPPIPLASKPPIPLATKPNMSMQTPMQQQPQPQPQTQLGVCMTCRDFSGPDTHATRYPRHSLPTTDLQWLAIELTGPFPSPTDKARALFTWMHHNIYYDVNSFFGGTVKGRSPEETLVSGLAVCDGYSGLYMSLAAFAGLECRKLSGHGKGFGYRPLSPGEPSPTPSAGHAWNAVRIDGGEWKLIDSTWGSGHVNADHTYSKSFHEDYFTMSNEEFSLKHFPLQNGRPAPESDFYFSAGMKPPTWEEYIQINPSAPTGVERPIVYSNVKENHGIGKYTLQPAGRDIDVSSTMPIRFQFGLQCPHWSLQRHSKKEAPYVFIFIAKGRDGSKSEYIAFHHHRGNSDGSGDIWYADVQDPGCLGPPGGKLVLFAVTSFGDWKDARGLTREEFMRGIGKVGMGFQGVVEWRLV